MATVTVYTRHVLTPGALYAPALLQAEELTEALFRKTVRASPRRAVHGARCKQNAVKSVLLPTLVRDDTRVWHRTNATHLCRFVPGFAENPLHVVS